MGLWVRVKTQKQQQIVEINDVWIKQDFDIKLRGIWRTREIVPNGKYCLRSNAGRLATYGTEERAIQVLDSIQKFIFEKSNINKVFEMPTE